MRCDAAQPRQEETKGRVGTCGAENIVCRRWSRGPRGIMRVDRDRDTDSDKDSDRDRETDTVSNATLIWQTMSQRECVGRMGLVSLTSLKTSKASVQECNLCRVCVQLNTQTDRHAQTNRQTDTQTDVKQNVRASMQWKQWAL